MITIYSIGPTNRINLNDIEDELPPCLSPLAPHTANAMAEVQSQTQKDNFTPTWSKKLQRKKQIHKHPIYHKYTFCMAEKYEQRTVQTQARKSKIIFLTTLLTDDLLCSTTQRSVQEILRLKCILLMLGYF